MFRVSPGAPSGIMEKAVIISIIAGFFLAVGLVLGSERESYSSLYLYPDSYSNYPEGNTTKFIYGITSSEKRTMDYIIQFYRGEKLVEEKQIQLQPGETFVEEKILDIAGVALPVKVRIDVKAQDKVYSVHYWLKEK